MHWMNLGHLFVPDKEEVTKLLPGLQQKDSEANFKALPPDK